MKKRNVAVLTAMLCAGMTGRTVYGCGMQKQME